MSKRTIFLCCLLLVESRVYSQTRIDLSSQSKSIDFSGADSTKPFQTGTTLPASCSAGEAFFKTDATPGSNLYLCVAPNSWTQTTAGNLSSGSLANRPANCTTGQLYFSTDTGAEGWSYCQVPGNPGSWSALENSSANETWTCSAAIPTAYTLVKLDSSAAGGILPVHTGDTAPYGIALSTCAAGATVEVAHSGRVQCLADTSGADLTTPGNAAIVSPTFDGYCMDSGNADTAAGNLTRLVGVIQNAATTGAPVTVVLSPWHYGNQIMQSTLPAPYSGWDAGAVLSGGGAGAPPTVTSVTIDSTNSISTPGSLNTGVGSGSAGSIIALRGTGVARLGIQGGTSGEWDITAPDNFNSWSFTPPQGPCSAHQWWTTDPNGNGSCMQPASSDLADGSNLGFLNATQAFSGDNTFNGRFDASQAPHTLPAKVGLAASKPGTCTIGEMYFATDATAGRNWYYCTAANTWTQQVAGSGSSGASIASTGNLIAGDGAGNGADSGIAASSVAVKNGSNAYTGTQDNSAAAHTLPAKVGLAASKPGTCTIGEMYFATDATAGQNWYYCTAANTWTQQLNSGSAGGGARNLSGTGTAAKCQSGIAGAAFSIPASTYQPSNNAPPSASCEADGLHAYVGFTANTAQMVSDAFELPADWAGTLKLVLSAWSTSTNAPTITVSLICLGSGATTGGTYGTAQGISLTPGGSSGRTAATTALSTDAAHATKACAAGDLVQWKLSVTAAAAANLNVAGLRFTE